MDGHDRIPWRDILYESLLAQYDDQDEGTVSGSILIRTTQTPIDEDTLDTLPPGIDDPPLYPSRRIEWGVEPSRKLPADALPLHTTPPSEHEPVTLPSPILTPLRPDTTLSLLATRSSAATIGAAATSASGGGSVCPACGCTCRTGPHTTPSSASTSTSTPLPSLRKRGRDLDPIDTRSHVMSGDATCAYPNCRKTARTKARVVGTVSAWTAGWKLGGVQDPDQPCPATHSLNGVLYCRRHATLVHKQLTAAPGKRRSRKSMASSIVIQPTGGSHATDETHNVVLQLPSKSLEAPTAHKRTRTATTTPLLTAVLGGHPTPDQQLWSRHLLTVEHQQQTNQSKQQLGQVYGLAIPIPHSSSASSSSLIIPGRLNVYVHVHDWKRTDGLVMSCLSSHRLGPIDHGQPNLESCETLANLHLGNTIFPWMLVAPVSSVEACSSSGWDTYLVSPVHALIRSGLYRSRELYYSVLEWLTDSPAVLAQCPTVPTKERTIYPAFYLWRDVDGRDRRYSAIQARYFTCCGYERLVTASGTTAYTVWDDVKQKRQNGIALQFCGPHGVTGDLCKLTQHDWDRLYLSYQQEWHDDLILACMLVVGEPAQFPWHRYRRQHSSVYHGITWPMV